MINEDLKKEIEKSKEFLIIVEGKKDKSSLQELGFPRIFVLNENEKSLPERIESLLEIYRKRDKVCILTDLDKKGKQLYLMLKPKLQELGVKMDNSLRETLLREHISHIEGLASYIKNHEQ